MSTPATLFLIPSLLGDGPADVLPPATLEAIKDIRHFIVDDERSARRFLGRAGFTASLDDVTLYVLNHQTKKEDVVTYLAPALKGLNIGVLSEAGCPGVADPGAEAVKIAHLKKIKVKPL